MYACVHNGQLNLKLIKAATGAAPPPGPTPLRKRRAPGVENEHQNNTQVAPPSNSAPDFEFAPQEAAPVVPTSGTVAIAPVRAARAKRTPRLRKVLPNKRISGSATSAEVRLAVLLLFLGPTLGENNNNIFSFLTSIECTCKIYFCVLVH
jgi:hypothetical protein